MTALTREGSTQALGTILQGITGHKLDRKTRISLAPRAPRSGQPVWRNSYYKGQIEDRIWKPINGGKVRGGKRWTAALLKAAKAYELKSRAARREKEPGARNGALGEVGIAVLEFLYDRVDFATGRLDPALRTIADAIGRSYSAVHDALRRLRLAGFLNWMRRSEKIADAAPGAPQIRQISNAYGLLCPEAMRDRLNRLVKDCPLPACELDRRQQQDREFEEMIGQLSASEYIDTFVDDELLGPTLARMAAAIDARDQINRESGRADETGRDIIYPLE